MSVIRWEDPPTEHGNAKPKKPPKFQPIADALRGRPNEWALIDDSRTHGSAGSFAHHIRNGSGPWAPAGTFEAKVIGSAGASRARVYARYVGEPSPGGEAAREAPTNDLSGGES